MDEGADLEGESGLGADGLEQTQVGGGGGLLGALGAEADEAGQLLAAGEGQQQFGAESIERLALAIVGEQEPSVWIFAVEGGGLIGAREVADGRGALLEALGQVVADADAMLDAKAAAVAQIDGDRGDVQD